MGVWRLPERQDPRKYYPKPPYVEKRKCKAFACKERRSVSFPWVKKNPWCTTHSVDVYFAGQPWMSPEVRLKLQKAAEPPKTFGGWLLMKWRNRGSS